eukprot:GHVU01213479.1.p1 GENE.GHVU01213479.1~~GHVU01213479.1.p1  ORF type:complete len:334 (+),score=60.23 GHVU01213479.1:1917-2918(+)
MGNQVTREVRIVNENTAAVHSARKGGNCLADGSAAMMDSQYLLPYRLEKLQQLQRDIRDQRIRGCQQPESTGMMSQAERLRRLDGSVAVLLAENKFGLDTDNAIVKNAANVPGEQHQTVQQHLARQFAIQRRMHEALAAADDGTCKKLQVQLIIPDIHVRILRYDGGLEDVNVGGMIFRSRTKVPETMVRATLRDWEENPQDLADTAITNSEDPILKRKVVAENFKVNRHEYFLLGAQWIRLNKEFVVYIRERRTPESHERFFVKDTSGKQISNLVLPEPGAGGCACDCDPVVSDGHHNYQKALQAAKNAGQQHQEESGGGKAEGDEKAEEAA